MKKIDDEQDLYAFTSLIFGLEKRSPAKKRPLESTAVKDLSTNKIKKRKRKVLRVLLSGLTCRATLGLEILLLIYDCPTGSCH